MVLSGVRGVIFWGLFLIPAVGFAAPPLLEKSPQFSDTIQDQQGRLHTVWVSQGASSSALHYQIQDPSGRRLAGPILLSEGSARLRRPQVVIDGRNTAHFLWQERTAESSQGETTIRYTKLTVTPTGVMALLPQPITLNTDLAATHPSLAVDQTGWAYAVWEIEGLEVKLAAIDPSGHISQVRRITREATKTDHALPTVGVDRRGNVHVVWSTQAGDKTQLVYKALRGHDGRVLEKEKVVYTAKGRVDQAKVVTFDPQGNVKVSWVSFSGRQPGQKGRLARLGAKIGAGSLVLRSTAGTRTIAAVMDKSIQPAPDRIWSPSDEAIASPKPWLAAPSPSMERVMLAASSQIRKPSHADQAVSKLLMAQLLRYSTWSAPPPEQVSFNFHPRSSSLSVPPQVFPRQFIYEPIWRGCRTSSQIIQYL